MTEQPLSNVAEIDETVTCAAIIDDEDMGVGPCGATSRFIVSRSDGDTSYGINGGSEEACEKHLADAVLGMVEGDVNVHAIVAIRWDPSEDLSGSMFPGRPGYLTGTCGHAVAQSEWKAGFRTCERCPRGTNIYVPDNEDEDSIDGEGSDAASDGSG